MLALSYVKKVMHVSGVISICSEKYQKVNKSVRRRSLAVISVGILELCKNNHNIYYLVIDSN